MNLPFATSATTGSQNTLPSNTLRRRWLLITRTRRAREAMAALVVGLAAFGVYLTTVAPTVLAVTGDARDAVRFHISVPLLGTGHATGYPTFILLGKLFTYLPFGDPAYRLNLMAAFFGAFAAALLFLVARELGSRSLPAAGAALILAFSATFWSQANMAEVYTMNAAFLLGVTYLLLLWRQRGRGKFLLGAALLYGISLGNHASMILLAPAYLALAVGGRRKELSSGLLARAGILGVLGTAIYLYIPIRGFAGAWHPYYAPASTPTEVWHLVTGARVHRRMGSSLPEVVAHMEHYAVEFGRQAASQPLGWILAIVLLLIGALGIGTVLRRDRAVGIFLLLAFGAELLYALNYRINDIAVYYIPTYVLLAIGFAVGMSVLAARLSRASALVLVVPLLLAGAVALTNYQHVDLSENYDDRAAAEALLARLPPNAIVYGQLQIYPPTYLVRVEGQRPDVEFRWVSKHIGESIPQDLGSGRPVYLISSREYNRAVFLSVSPYARFVPEGPLIRLLPREDSRSARSLRTAPSQRPWRRMLSRLYRYHGQRSCAPYGAGQPLQSTNGGWALGQGELGQGEYHVDSRTPCLGIAVGTLLHSHDA